MKKLAILVLAMMLFMSVGYAAPTNVNVGWNGAGSVWQVSQSTDVHTTFNTWGDLINGQYTLNQNGDNPYGYGIETQNDYLDAEVANGLIEKQTVKLTNKESMYGPAGATSYDYVFVSGGTGALAMGNSLNFAEMNQGTYSKPKTDGGYNFEANATYFEMGKELSAGTWGGNMSDPSLDYTPTVTPEITRYAYVSAIGSGEASLNAMCSEVKTKSSMKLGHGCGCYTNANYTGNGTGTFQFGGAGGEAVTFEGLYDQNGNKISTTGDGTYNSARLSFSANYSTTTTDYSFVNYATTVR